VYYSCSVTFPFVDLVVWIDGGQEKKNIVSMAGRKTSISIAWRHDAQPVLTETF